MSRQHKVDMNTVRARGNLTYWRAFLDMPGAGWKAVQREIRHYLSHGDLHGYCQHI